MTGNEILLCLAIWSCVLLTLTTVKPLCAITDPKHHNFPSQSPIVGICRKFYNFPWFLTSCKQPWLTHGHLCLLHILHEELLGTAWNYACHNLETACNKFSFRLFTVLNFSVRSSRSSALRFGLHLAWSPTPAPSVHLKIKMAVINGKTCYISTISRKNRGLWTV